MKTAVSWEERPHYLTVTHWGSDFIYSYPQGNRHFGVTVMLLWIHFFKNAQLPHIIFKIWVESGSKNGFRKGFLGSLFAALLISKRSSTFRRYKEYQSLTSFMSYLPFIGSRRGKQPTLSFGYSGGLGVRRPLQERAYDHVSESYIMIFLFPQ